MDLVYLDIAFERGGQGQYCVSREEAEKFMQAWNNYLGYRQLYAGAAELRPSTGGLAVLRLDRIIAASVATEEECFARAEQSCRDTHKRQKHITEFLEALEAADKRVTRDQVEAAAKFNN